MKETNKGNSPAAGVVPGAQRRSWGGLRTFASLAFPAFRLYYGANIFMSAASNMEMMIRSLLVFRITGSAASIGVMALAGTVPHIISSLLGGVIADRLHKKYILVIMGAAFALLALGIAVSLTTGYLNSKTWWILIVNSIVWNFLIGLKVPAQQSIIREMVGRDHLMNAISLNTAAMNAIALAMPTAAGLIIDRFGFEAIFYLQAIFYTLGTILVVFMPLTGKLPTLTESALKNLNNGFKYIFSEPNLMVILAFTFIGIVFAMPFQQFLPVFTDKILNTGAKGLGILTSVSALGAIAGSLTLASLPNRRRGLIMLIGTTFLGLSIIVFSFSRSWPLSLAIMLGVGVGTTARQALSNTLTQHNTLKDEFRGRVMGVYDMLISFYLAATFGIGLLAKALGVEKAMAGFATVLVVFCVLGWLFVPRLRRMD